MNTQTITKDSKQTPKTPRAMVALIVLAEHVPMPVRITFQGEGVGEAGRSIMSMSFRNVAEGQAWSHHLGGRTDTHVSPTTGVTWLHEGCIEWHGWSVQLHACNEPAPADSLSDSTLTRLVALAGGDRS